MFPFSVHSWYMKLSLADPLAIGCELQVLYPVGLMESYGFLTHTSIQGLSQAGCLELSLWLQPEQGSVHIFSLVTVLHMWPKTPGKAFNVHLLNYKS